MWGESRELSIKPKNMSEICLKCKKIGWGYIQFNKEIWLCPKCFRKWRNYLTKETKGMNDLLWKLECQKALLKS
uniref:Uncharacterized protein n=1 Tax=viral metagenome TaxID=1070528 RepID=A0A6M3Y4W3_9ZZZZ